MPPVEKKEEVKVTPNVAPPLDSKPTPPQSPKSMASEAKPLPLPIQDIIGTPQEQTVRNWNAQAKAGIIFQCKEDGCYYPAAPVRDANNQPVVFQTRYTGPNGKVFVKTEFVMTCTYHPEHGKEIALPNATVVLKNGDRIKSVVGFRMSPPKKDDDFDLA